MKNKLFRIAALPGSLRVLLTGQLAFMNSYYEVVAVASEGESHELLRENENIRTIAVNINRKISPIADLVTLLKLYSVFRKEKPYIVHSITPKAGLLSMMAAYLARVPHRMHTFTGLIFPTRKGIMKKVLIFFDKVICLCATRVYPEGQGVKNDLISYGITKKPLKIIANGNVNGIDLAHFDPSPYDENELAPLRKRLGIKESDFVFLFIGRIGFDKGIKELIEAFKMLQTTYDAKLLLVGTYEKQHDPLPQNIEQEIETNSNIISVGWQTDVRPYFALGNVFVFPSYREGFPNVVIQAGAMGKFSIVTDINGSNEIVEDDDNGKIIPVKDADALVGQMSKCIENKAKYQKPNPHYRKLIAKKYERSIVWNALLEEYRSLDDR